MTAVFVLLLLGCFSAGAEGNPEPYDRVIIFGVDGAGTLFPEGDAPNFHRIFDGGIITNEARATVPTISAPGWGAVFYGVPGKVHGSANSYALSNHHVNVLYPSIFRLTREAYPKAKVASFANWTPINWGLIERDCGVYFFPNNLKKPKMEDIAKRTIAYLKQNKPKLLFVYYEDLDDRLHQYGFGSGQYMEEIPVVDGQIGLVYDELEKKGLLENALVLFVTDHGGNKRAHGGGTDGETRVTFAIAGPRLEENGTVGDMELQDIAAIILYALGIEQPEYQTGRIPAGIFPGVGGGERKTGDLTETLNHYGKGASARSLPESSLPSTLAEKLVCYRRFDGETEEGLSDGAVLTAGLTGSGLNMRKDWLDTGIKHSVKWPGMSIGFWFRDDGDKEDPVFAADKSWEKGYFKGFVIAKLEDRIQINIGGGKNYRKDILWTLPEGYKGKWIHCLVTFDQDSREACLYIDFELVGKGVLLPAKHISWITKKAIVAGQDVTKKYRNRMNADMDELMIFNAALTPEEAGELRDYYEPLF